MIRDVVIFETNTRRVDAQAIERRLHLDRLRLERRADDFAEASRLEPGRVRQDLLGRGPSRVLASDNVGRLAGEDRDCTGQCSGCEADVGEPLESVALLELLGGHSAVGDASSGHAAEHPRLVLEPEIGLVLELVRNSRQLGVDENLDAERRLDEIDDVDPNLPLSEFADHEAQGLDVGQLQVVYRQAGLEFDAQPLGRHISTPDDVLDRVKDSGHGVSFRRASVVQGTFGVSKPLLGQVFIDNSLSIKIRPKRC